MRTILLCVSALLVGCFTAPAEDEAELSRAFAQVNPEPIEKKVGRCSVDALVLEVELMKPDVEKAINDELARAANVDRYLDAKRCAGGAVKIRTRQTAVYNDRGVLSVSVMTSVSEGAEELPTQSLALRNFDVRSGKVIGIDDLVDGTGIAVMRKVCEASLGAELGPHCSPAKDKLTFGIEGDGIRVYPTGVPADAFATAAEGVLVKWQALRGHVVSDLAKAIARH